jgi:CRISPR-associated protein Cmr4
MPNMLLVQAYSPLHAGTGQGVDVVDLPIARERPTNLPIVPGSSLKGSLRSASGENEATWRLFGPPTANASDHAGAVQFGDQTLLLLPVRSLAGTFAYLTCPFVLSRFARDARLASLNPPALPNPESRLLRTNAKDLVVQEQDDRVVLEDLDFKSAASAEVEAWAAWIGKCLYADGAPETDAGRDFLHRRLAVIADDTFHYLAENATEVVARIKLQDNTKTVQKGGLWYEEALPAESILWGMVHAEANGKVREGEALAAIGAMVKGRGVLQLGGKATVGRGVCRLQWVEG